jgi:hypothetical protein
MVAECAGMGVVWRVKLLKRREKSNRRSFGSAALRSGRQFYMEVLRLLSQRGAGTFEQRNLHRNSISENPVAKASLIASLRSEA